MLDSMNIFRATTKLSDITEEAKEKIDDIHADIENGTQTEEDSKKELTVTYAQTAVKIAKLYAPSVILGGLSIGAILTSNNMLRKRNVALAAAYTAIDKSFKASIDTWEKNAGTNGYFDFIEGYMGTSITGDEMKYSVMMQDLYYLSYSRRLNRVCSNIQQHSV